MVDLVSAAKRQVTTLADSAVQQVTGLFSGSAVGQGFSSQLQGASFRGVPFAVLAAQSRFGRRAVVHEYPYRDKPYVEDMGRALRRMSISGFLVTNSLVYGGGEVIAQRDRMVRAAETAGPGTLIHPTYGRLTVSLVDGGFSCDEKWDQGRYFEIGFTFLESGERVFPSAPTATRSAVQLAAAAVDAAAIGDFSTRALDALQQGAAIVSTAVSTAGSWADTALSLGNDATNLNSMVATLGGNFGRFGGGLAGFAAGVGVSGGSIQSLVGETFNAAEQLNFASDVPNLFTSASAEVPAMISAATANLNVPEIVNTLQSNLSTLASTGGVLAAQAAPAIEAGVQALTSQAAGARANIAEALASFQANAGALTLPTFGGF